MAQTGACFLKLSGPSFVHMLIGNSAKIVHDVFDLAIVITGGAVDDAQAQGLTQQLHH